MEIEEVAHSSPEAVARIPVVAADWRGRRQGTRDHRGLGRIPAEAAEGAALLAERLWRMSHRRGRHAGRGQPDGAHRRRPGPRGRRQGDAGRQRRRSARSTPGSPTPATADPIEARAKEKHLNYVKLDGEVGIIGNGASLVMSTLDVVAYAGPVVRRHQACQLPRHRRRRVGRGHGQRPEIVLSDPSVRSVFVNVFGGITACDAVANGIVSAIGMLAGRGEHVEPPDRGPAGRQQRRPRAGASCRRRRYPWSSRWRRWTARRGGRPSCAKGA